MIYEKSDHFKNIEIIALKKHHTYYGDFYSILDNKIYKSLRGLINTFRHYNITSKEYYRKYYMRDGEGKCENDSSYDTKFLNLVVGYKKTCGKCDGCRKIIRENQSKAANNPETKRIKVHYNNIWRRNNKNTINQLAKDRAKKMKMLYGDDYFSVKAKKQWESKSKEERKEIGIKSVNTKRINGTLNSNNIGRCNKHIKINDEIYFTQGYEDLVLYYLHELGYKFGVGSNVPKIRSDINISGYYRPDIFIKDLNLIIEVKSEYTFFVGFDKIVNAFSNSFEDNYNYVVFCLQPNNKRELYGEDLYQIKMFLDMIISSQPQNYFEKVQRLSRDWEYRPIVIGSGSARVPKERYFDLYHLRNVI